jgi:hypothetical protein
MIDRDSVAWHNILSAFKGKRETGWTKMERMRFLAGFLPVFKQVRLKFS